MAESRKRQKENKERRLREAKERAERWQQQKKTEIVYLGEEVSGGLSDKTSDPEKLNAYNLPDFADAAALARAMQISVGKLRFLAFNRRVNKISHYKRFYMRKKSGGKRLISAPMPQLKAAQHWLLENVLYKVPVHTAVHGFVPGRSIVSNARPHVGADVVVNIDLKDFFPTVKYKRAKGAFAALGYSQHIATIFALLCTEPEVDVVELDGQPWYVAKGDRVLPQGAPTSPALTNIICKRLDARLSGLARKFGFAYTRYADDMTLSASGDAAGQVSKILGMVRRVLYEEGFHLHPDKLRVMRNGQRKEVTGIVVNDKLAVPRKRYRKFKALLFQVEMDGPEGKSWEGAENFWEAIRGYAAFVKMVEPVRGTALLEHVERLQEKHAPRPKKKRKPQAETSSNDIDVAIDGGDPSEETPPKKRRKYPHERNKPNQNDENSENPNDADGEDKPWWKIW
ncbi:MAG: reverse transcriptase family protein [Bacteroidota bacterium]